MSNYQKDHMVDGRLVEDTSYAIGDILTRHAAGHNAKALICAKVLELRRTAGQSMPSQQRLQQARETACTCGHG